MSGSAARKFSILFETVDESKLERRFCSSPLYKSIVSRAWDPKPPTECRSLRPIVDESKLERGFCSTETPSADRVPSSMPPYVGLRHARDCSRFQEDTVSRAWYPEPPYSVKAQGNIITLSPKRGLRGWKRGGATMLRKARGLGPVRPSAPIRSDKP